MQRHGEHHTRAAGAPANQLGHHRLALHQCAAQAVALGRLQTGSLLETPVAQVHTQLAVLPGHLHKIEQLHGRQALLEQSLQLFGRIEHVGRNAGRHGAQRLLGLFNLAGQHTRHHFGSIGLLHQQALQALLAGGARHQPASQRT